MARKPSPEKDNSERYLISYADLMNLLLILFIVLYSISKTDVAKAAVIAESMRKGFNASVNATDRAQSPLSSPTTSTAISGGNGNYNTADSGNDYSQFYDQLMDLINKAGMEDQVQVTADSSDVVITLKDTALYAPGVASMNQTSSGLITSIGGLLSQVTYAMVMVEGYTDSDPIHNAQFQDNLDLSTARANNVNRLLVTCGVPREKICSLGHGENDPVAPNDTAAHKAQNRRVVLTIFKSMNNLTPNQIIAARDLLSLQSATSSQTTTVTVPSSAVSSSSAASSSSSSKASSSKASSPKASSSSKSSSK